MIRWRLNKSLEASVSHVMGRLRFLSEKLLATHPGCLQVQEKATYVNLLALNGNKYLQ